MRLCLLSAAIFAVTSLAAQQSSPPHQPAAQPTVPSTALTIYNENFAVARTPIQLDLHPGANEVSTTQVTSQLEPDSVVLRDPSGQQTFHIVEQNYDAGIVDQNSMLRKYEGKTIDFEVGPVYPNGVAMPSQSESPRIVSGKIVRAPRDPDPYQQYRGQIPNNQPLIEINGQLEFQLPGLPLFPASTDGLLLQPTLRWQIDSARAQHLSAELAYITSGLSWEATYNIVAPTSGEAAPSDEKAGLLGWVTIHNNSGTEFPAARIKLMAGDVAKITPQNQYQLRDQIAFANAAVAVNQSVTQKAFDDFHLYDLNRTVSLLNGETKQVQFIDASGVTLARSYRYYGAADLQNYQNNSYINQQPDFGLDPANTKVQILESFKNSAAIHLGMPLPAGRVRLYRRDSDGQMEFIGESLINHTPADDTVRIVTGNAFDVKGARRQTDFHVNMQDRIVDESFEIHLTNQKTEPVTVSVVEPMYRGLNWEIRDKSADFTKLDARTVEFPVQVPAKGEATLTYSVRYTW